MAGVSQGFVKQITLNLIDLGFCVSTAYFI
jgi:hypothetical protein